MYRAVPIGNSQVLVSAADAATNFAFDVLNVQRQ